MSIGVTRDDDVTIDELRFRAEYSRKAFSHLIDRL